MSGLRICFSHRTALQVLRTTRSDLRRAARSASVVLPDQAPSKEELAGIVEQLRVTHPGIRVDRPAHVLVGSSERRRLSGECCEHVATASLAGRSFYRLAEGVCVSAPSFALVQLAAGVKDPIVLLELAYELCGTYQTPQTGVASAYDVEPLASLRELRDFVSRNPSLHGARKIARILRYAAEDSASPRETKQTLVLGLPRMRGGYALGVPRMNYVVRASPAARALTGKSFFRCDLCWPEAKLDVEYQSRWAHEGEAKRIEDSRRANALASMGWTVVGITNDELDSLSATDAIADTIRRHLGKRAQVNVADYHARKLRLRRQLGLPVGWE